MPEWNPPGPDADVHKMSRIFIPVSVTARTKSKVIEYDPNNIEALDFSLINQHFRWEVDRAGHQKRIYRLMVYKFTNPQNPDEVHKVKTFNIRKTTIN